MRALRAIGGGASVAIALGSACSGQNDTSPPAPAAPASASVRPPPPEAPRPVAPPPLAPSPVVAPPRAPEPAISPLPLAAAPSELSLTLATYAGDELQQCADLSLTPPPGKEEEAAEQIEQLARDSVRATALEVTVRLQERCGERYLSKAVLGTCQLEHEKNGGRFSIVSRHYRLPPSDGADAPQLDCLGVGGVWKQSSAPGEGIEARAR